MKINFLSSVYWRRSLVIWALFCIIAAAIFLSYVFTSLANGQGTLLMPLDDVYIHFQYARQLAAGQPYVYNPGLAPTSGATSFLYPYILSLGYLFGFQGLQLSFWAIVVGAVALCGSMWLVYKLACVLGTGDVLAVLVAVAFGTNGAVAWHFMSGMETGLVILFTLGTLYAVITYDNTQVWRVIISATLLALIRPEGGLLAVIAVGAVAWKTWGNRWQFTSDPRRWWQKAVLVVPVLAVGVQPLVNLLLTGSAVASGNAAKSVLGAVPFELGDVIRRIIENFVRMWVEFGTGISPREGLYIMPLLLVLAAVGIGLLLIIREMRPVGVMLVLWLVGGTLMLATLDTAFWHFKRYQMPFMALLFPLAGWGIGVVGSFKLKVEENLLPQRHRDAQNTSRNLSRANLIAFVVMGCMLLVSGITSIQFLRYYGLNVGYVYQQPLQMARWLEANTPIDAIVAVHDVGMMRYMGGRTTLDIVGLTTKGAADYWRNGPGSVAEFLIQERPDYIASYGEGHGYGMGMIAQTSIYGAPLASFLVELDNTANVALAANVQGIYKPDWDAINIGAQVSQPSILAYLEHMKASNSDSPARAFDNYTINVANVQSEHSNYIDYERTSSQGSTGFATDVRQMSYTGCITDCEMIVDGGRRITGEEQFTLRGLSFDSSDIADVILVTRVHPEFSGTLDIYTDCSRNNERNWQLVSRRWIPEIPGHWLELATLIPDQGGCSPIFRIVPTVTNGAYFPFHHWIYLGDYQPENLAAAPIATFQNGAIQLGAATLDYRPDEAKLNLNLDWYTDGSATGDYKVFVHLYQNLNEPPVAQMDTRPGNGTLSPGNWLPGVLHDTITVDLNNVSAGQYQVAIGMYDSVTFERLQPTGGDEQGRLFMGEVEINR